MWSFVKKQKEILSYETGAIVKDWGGKTSVALIYPNTYHVGMSNLALHSLYKLLNDDPAIVCERAFLPDPKDKEELLRTQSPVISIETQRPLSEFDCLAFSISFQNDFLNIIPILAMSSIPHRRNQRNRSHPLIIAGGCAITMNPHPLSDIFDAFVIGEYEALSKKSMAHLLRKDDCEKNILGLSRTKGFYVPSHPAEHSKRLVAEDLDLWSTETVIETKDTEFKDMHLIEMSRGCPRYCRFCATPSLYEPYRARKPGSVLKSAKTAAERHKRVGLIGADLLSQKVFFETVSLLKKHGIKFSPSSVRVDSINEEVAMIIAEGGHKSISLGIEAATDRLRASLGKKFTNAGVIKAVSTLASHGILNLRLYFMIGLPGERKEDINAIADLSVEIQTVLRKTAPKKSRTSSVTLTITPFIPKPMTFFEREPFAGEKYLKETLRTLHKLLKKKEGIKIHSDSILSSVCDAVLSRGDGSLIEFLEQYHKTNSVRKALMTLKEEDIRHLEQGFKKDEKLPWENQRLKAD